jgi:hypothetical protein
MIINNDNGNEMSGGVLNSATYVKSLLWNPVSAVTLLFSNTFTLLTIIINKNIV